MVTVVEDHGVGAGGGVLAVAGQPPPALIFGVVHRLAVHGFHKQAVVPGASGDQALLLQELPQVLQVCLIGERHGGAVGVGDLYRHRLGALRRLGQAGLPQVPKAEGQHAEHRGGNDPIEVLSFHTNSS